VAIYSRVKQLHPDIQITTLDSAEWRRFTGKIRDSDQIIEIFAGRIPGAGKETGLTVQAR
jgi:hypothetical protein